MSLASASIRRTSASSCSLLWLAASAAFALTVVPSTATTPTFTSPASRQVRSTGLNSAASSSSWSWRKSPLLRLRLWRPL